MKVRGKRVLELGTGCGLGSPRPGAAPRAFKQKAQAAQGELWHWRGDAQGRLAEILVLDQFSRNIHRGSPQAFAYDRFAGPLAGMLLARRAHLQLAPFERFFLTMPLEHSENPEQQELGVVATTALMEHVQQRDGFEGPTVKYFEEVTAARSGRAELIKQVGLTLQFTSNCVCNSPPIVL